MTAGLDTAAAAGGGDGRILAGDLDPSERVFRILFALIGLVYVAAMSLREISFDAIIDAYTYIQFAHGDDFALGYQIKIIEPALFWLLQPVAFLKVDGLTLTYFHAVSILTTLVLVARLSRSWRSATFAAFFLLSTPTFFVLSANLWRQDLACILLLLAMLSTSRRWTLVFSALAITTHVSAAPIVPFLFLFRAPRFLVNRYALAVVFGLVASYLIARLFGDLSYAAYLEDDTDQFQRRLFLAITAVGLVTCCEDGYLRRLSVGLILFCSLLLAGPIFARFSHYPMFFSLLCLGTRLRATSAAKLFILGYVVLSLYALMSSKTFCRSFGLDGCNY